MNLLDIVKKLEGHTDGYRQDIIIRELRHNLGVSYGFHNYTGPNKDHRFNIISRPEPRRKWEIGVSCHSDAVPGSPGANDNASSVAVTLEILRRYKESPLEFVGVRGMFFDEEEKRLIGSSEYVKAGFQEGLIGLYNMELVGMGNNLVIWQEGSGHSGGPVRMSLEEAADIYKVKHMRIGEIIINAADHIPFFNEGIWEAYTLVALTDKDVLLMPEYIAAQYSGQRLQDLDELKSRIPVFEHYHEPTDTSEHLSEDTLQMVSDVLWEALNVYDRQYSGVPR